MALRFITFSYDVFNYEILKEPQSIVIGIEETEALGVFTKRLFNPRTEKKEWGEAFYIRYEGAVYGKIGLDEEEFVSMATNKRVYILRNFYGEKVGYPVGVVNVNGNIVGNAANADEYVQVWNGDAANSDIGVLSALPSGKFSLAVVIGKKIPDNLYGLRYFQFDTTGDRVDTITIPHKGFIDFGDGKQLYCDGKHKFDFDGTYGTYKYGGATGSFGNIGMYWKYDAGGGSTLWDNGEAGTEIYAGYMIKEQNWSLGHIYKPDAPATKTVTIYHNDNEYFHYDDNSYSSQLGNAKKTNLRGNLPKKTWGMMLTGTESATYNTFDNVNFDEFKDYMKFFECRNGGGGSVKNLNFGHKLGDLTGLEALVLLDIQTDKKPSELLGYNTVSVLPNLKTLVIYGYGSTITFEPEFDVVFANARQFCCWPKVGMTTAWLESVVTRLYAAKNDLHGAFYLAAPAGQPFSQLTLDTIAKLRTEKLMATPYNN